MVSRGFNKAAGVLLTLAMVLSVGACSFDSTQIDISGGPTIAIGVASDIPGVGFEHDGAYSGFDVEIARYVAHKLGYSDKQITIKHVVPAARVDALERNVVDILVSPLHENDVNTQRAGSTNQNENFEFAGPALITWQDFLAPATQRRELAGSHGLDGKRICTVKGLGDEDGVTQAASGAQLRQYADYGQCLTALMAHEVDAISADDASLRGFSSKASSVKLSLLGKKVSKIEHGVWTKRGTTRLKEKISDILTSMINDGAWTRAVHMMRDTTGYVPDMKLNPPRVNK